MDFSIMFFSGGEGQPGADGRYDNLREAAQRADAAGLKRIWLPERHFVQFGALHPNPAVLAAFLACCTTTIRIAAGSVVAPLHDPIRIAEEWSVVDNLSGGRVDLALASGWLSSDFVLAPDLYDSRHRELRKRVREVRALWSGASLTRTVNGAQHAVAIRPRPVKQELPLWITAARSTETFRYAGSIGGNVLTYLVDLGFDGLESAIAAYRDARAENGFAADEGCVTVMVHSFLGEDSGQVRRVIAQPYRDYLLNNRDLLLQSGRAGGAINLQTLAEMADVQLDRVFEKLSLIGSFEAAHATLDRLSRIGATEVACLVDFVEDGAMVLQSVARIAQLAQAHALRDPLAEADDRPDLTADATRFYDYIGSLGGFYGEEFRLIERVTLRGDQAEAILTVKDVSEQGKAIVVDSLISTAHGFALRPGLRGSTTPLAMPAGVGAMTVGDLRPGRLIVTTRARGRKGNLDYFDAVARDADGAVVAELNDIAFNRLKLASSDPRVVAASGTLHECVWRPSEAGAVFAEGPKFVVDALAPGEGAAWISAFREAGFEARGQGAEPPDGAAAPAEWHALVIGSPDPDLDTIEAAQARVCQIADWVKTLRARERSANWVVLTRGAQRLADSEQLPEPVAAAAWAAAGSFSPPGLTAPSGAIDVAEADAASARAIAKAVLAGRFPAAVRQGQLFQMTIEPVARPEVGMVRDPADSMLTRGALVLGGSGALGAALTEWLGEEGATPIATVSRRGAVPGGAMIQRTPLTHCQGDAATQPVRDILGAAGQAPEAFGTLFHLAGVDLPETGGVTADHVRGVFKPKLGGLRQLESLLDDMASPRHVVLFSSLAALRGSLGQVAYSAANAAAAAALRRLVAGTPHCATIVHFGPWAGGGMAASPELDPILELKGVERLAPEIALRALGLALSTGRQEVVIAQFASALQPKHALSLGPGWPLETADGPGRPAPSVALSAFGEIAPAARRDYLIDQLRAIVADTIECDVEEVDVHANLYDLGFDSLMAVDLRNTLSEQYGVEVELVVLMDARTIADIAERLLPLVDAALCGTQAEAAANTFERMLVL